jgi:GntR family transcriptional regulator
VTSQFVPRYYEIEQALRTRIAELEPGDALPSDSMLCDEFGVSRMTARNAVQRLAQEGLVQRIPGRGTFVARPPSPRQASNLLSFSDEMRRRGRSPSSAVLQRELRPPSDPEMVRLELGRRDEVLVILRLRLADDEPVALETAVIPGSVAPILEEADLEHGSLHAALVAGGRVPTGGRATLGAEVATAQDARRLGIKRGAPLFIERRLIFDEAGRPLEFTESRYVAGRYALDVEFDVELPPAAPPERGGARRRAAP